MPVPIYGVNKKGEAEPFKVSGGKLLLELQLNRFVMLAICLIPIELLTIIVLLLTR